MSGTIQLAPGAAYRNARKEHGCNATRACYVRNRTACPYPDGLIVKGEQYIEQYGDSGDMFHPDRYHLDCYARVRQTTEVAQ